MKGPPPTLLRRLCFAWAGFLVLVIALANSGQVPWLFAWVDQRLPGRDFTGHFVLMGTFSLLANLALGAPRVERLPIPILRGSLLVAAGVVLEECSQLFLTHRNFSWVDLAADGLGILLFGELGAWMVSRRSPSTKAS